MTSSCIGLLRKHQRPDNRKRKNSHSKSECDDTHPALLELTRGAGEEKHCGKENSVREVLTGNSAGVARFLQATRSLSGSLGGLARSPYFVEFRHKRMRVGVWIFKRPFGQPCVVSLAHIRWKTLVVKIHALLIASLFCELHWQDPVGENLT